MNEHSICDKCNKQDCETERISDSYNSYDLCSSCVDQIEDKTGYCGLNCQIFGQCGGEC